MKKASRTTTLTRHGTGSSSSARRRSLRPSPVAWLAFLANRFLDRR